ncbi:tRNA (adenosine(37)-N6)-threonylcarbamoyltransferase complex ATPase subunit type 1 TsaE [Candidatus Falkowbacteria bacterium CG10_big_fil_rev_8_21_14_0_10_37_14]|uniref:tRNA threonylcarbamoyladenosine biosynthesis protein TsaE n=1 Tax=Candidatus Falkowbacteria bacterium CG10_big_fil_rev_8_21_14_0_10_37_14 TaxID=1974561 RepID=A0A2M6WSA8_9BACT|nr:tRNA (adenosine(37)-N6)-threonylcarbamoyltransferase complex ATPase subunit type 1 TsaE [Candidatus Falkowbacteria bacterium]PIT95654.1 MAG: tRNA (adenosine(37)-N6)-threonylcarbamoyltransferase complex ATPase subunit type 1 TsaE [Candidatus Falkowbacteria bacterium CG10_big_fil_rev_8_21_14_0_10_37_14]
MKFITYTEQSTEDLAAGLAREMVGGEVLALVGELGAGKTAFCRGLAKGLKVTETVNSPTFVVMRVYDIKKAKIKQFVHIDAYRLNQGKELTDIGVDDYLGQNDVVMAIEWADKVTEIWPAKVKVINFKTKEDGGREIEVY